MLREKNLFVSSKNLIFSLALFFFTLFIGLGNLPRLLESSLFSDHLLVSELFLYFFALLSLMFCSLSFRSCGILLSCLGLTLIFFFYGCFLQGFDLHAALYTLRLMAFFLTSFSLSLICLEKFQGDRISFFSFLMKGYGIALCLSIVIFFLFFSSEKLFKELQIFRILFHGDPHVGRFVSVYFDPNYYASIVPIPILISYYLHKKTEEKKHLYIFLICTVSAILTWSRSGLFTLFVLFAFLFLFPLHRRGCSKEKLKKILFLSISTFSCTFFFLNEVKSFFLRFFFMGQDESALSRLYTFKWGIAVWKESPLFGIGYNFLYKEVKEEIGLNSLDSSLLSLLIQIGAVPFLGLALYGAYKAKALRNKILIWKKLEESVPQFLSGFFLYGALILFFSSHFNQLLFYPFWSLPFSVIFLFLMKSIQKKT